MIFVNGHNHSLHRQTAEPASVGPATLQDLLMLGVDTPAKLAASDPRLLYDELCRRAGQPVDICQYDIFCCAVAQARNENLPEECRNWAWWSSRCRKAGEVEFHPLLHTGGTSSPAITDKHHDKKE